MTTKASAAVEAEIAGHLERERLAREQFAAERRVGMLRAIIAALGALPTRSAEVTLGIWLAPEPEALEAVAMLEALGAKPTATCYVRSTGEGSVIVHARAILEGVEFRAQYRRVATEAEIEAASRGELVGRSGDVPCPAQMNAHFPDAEPNARVMAMLDQRTLIRLLDLAERGQRRSL